ncbi:recombinase family protein [Streptomyces broussonetiae]|jgi:DNA invertase Pin-like site-specific DNA recombinase|uniref:recombinase family protein n=1 Tax=Streptomyces broussonetiae TaxID=2686304 RepID=UPI0035DD778D
MPIAGPAQPAGWRVLQVIEQGSIVISTMEGQAIFGMLSVLAGPQRELIEANTNDGLASARARGRSGTQGKPPRAAQFAGGA